MAAVGLFRYLHQKVIVQVRFIFFRFLSRLTPQFLVVFLLNCLFHVYFPDHLMLAVVTADGHLYTWGSCYGNDALGHKGVRWQPSPRKVKRVHRAVGVSSAKEHTALLIGTSFPALPCLQPVSENVVLVVD